MCIRDRPYPSKQYALSADACVTVVAVSSDFNLAYSSSERVFFSDEDEEARVAGARRPVVGFPRARVRDDATRPRLPRKTRASVETTEDIASERAFVRRAREDARRDVTTMGASGPVDVSERRRTTRPST